MVIHILLFSVLAAFAFVLIFYVTEKIGEYNNLEFIQNQILAGEGSTFEGINAQTTQNIVFGALLDLAFWIAALFEFNRLRGMTTAIKVARELPKFREPYIPESRVNSILQMIRPGKSGLSAVRRSISLGYLKHCSIEDDRGNLYLSLSKKILRDTCPYCGAPLNHAAAGNSYFCAYCGRRLAGVVARK